MPQFTLGPREAETTTDQDAHGRLEANAVVPDRLPAEAELEHRPARPVRPAADSRQPLLNQCSGTSRVGQHSRPADRDSWWDPELRAQAERTLPALACLDGAVMSGQRPWTPCMHRPPSSPPSKNTASTECQHRQGGSTCPRGSHTACSGAGTELAPPQPPAGASHPALHPPPQIRLRAPAAAGSHRARAPRNRLALQRRSWRARGNRAQR